MAVQIIETNGVFLERETNAAGQVMSIKRVTSRKSKSTRPAEEKPKQSRRRKSDKFHPPQVAEVTATDLSNTRVQQFAQFVQFRGTVDAPTLSATWGGTTGKYIHELRKNDLIEVIGRCPTVYRWKGNATTTRLAS